MVVAVSCGGALAHPGNGVAIGSDGVVYFSDVERNVIWKVDADGRLSALAHGLHSHAISLDDTGHLWAEHLQYVPERASGSQWERTLVRLDPAGTRSRVVLGPTFSTEDFGGSPFTCGEGGSIVSLANAGLERPMLRRITTEGKSEPIGAEMKDIEAGETPLRGTIGGICAAPGGGFVLTQGMVVMRARSGSGATLMANLQDRPLPADAMSTRVNALWGVAADPRQDFVYVTDWDARTVHKVWGHGEVSTFARSRAPWSPTGVAVHGEKIYVLEHGLDGDRNLGPRVRLIDAAGGTDRVIATVE